MPQVTHGAQRALQTTPRNKKTWAAVEFGIQAMMNAAMLAWMERKPEEEILADEVGIIIGTSAHITFMHTDMSIGEPTSY